jgi:ribosomal protein S18 acetylase RimI-like enzyme
MHIRIATPVDLLFLGRMLYEAFYWNPNADRPSFEAFRQQPPMDTLRTLWDNSDNRAFIAEWEGRPVGAAWYRFGTDEDHSYGYVNPETPELGIALLSEYRSRGIGRALIQAVVQTLKAEGHPALSLSVDPHNYARSFYESEGFIRVGEAGTSWTYLLRFE